jgi:hypothetical protein
MNQQSSGCFACKEVYAVPASVIPLKTVVRGNLNLPFHTTYFWETLTDLQKGAFVAGGLLLATFLIYPSLLKRR